MEVEARAEEVGDGVGDRVAPWFAWPGAFRRTPRARAHICTSSSAWIDCPVLAVLPSWPFEAVHCAASRRGMTLARDLETAGSLT